MVVAALAVAPETARDANSPALAPVAGPIDHFRIDQSQSSVVARVHCLALLRCALRFRRMVGHYDVDPSRPQILRLSVTVDGRSSEGARETGSTRIAEEVLDLDRHPFITFNAYPGRLPPRAGGSLVGELTFRGVTRAVTFRVARIGVWSGGRSLWCSAVAVIKRSDFGSSSWGPLIGDEVRLTIDAHFTDSPPEIRAD
jgi:polyisoprenoid-binding protein YceI